MHERELVKLVEKETGAIFFGGYLIPPGDQIIASLSAVDRLWLEYFCRVGQMDLVGNIGAMTIQRILEDLHEIASQANALAMYLSTSRVFLVREPVSSEIAISE